MAKLRPDICVIGAGSGGLTVAAAAAAFGVPVVLIERGKMGGDCLNYGCVPSKSMIAAAKHAHSLTHGATFGVADADPQVDFSKVMRHVHQVIAAIAPNDSAERFTALGVTVIRGEARFFDGRTVTTGSYEIQARRFVIATGSSPFIPPIPGLDSIPYFTNETLFEQSERPAHLIVIGGGPVGLELAQAHRRLGSRVTVVEAAAALGKEDPELAEFVLKHLRSEGIEIFEHARLARVEKLGQEGVRIHFEDAAGTHAIDGSHLLVAAGRRPNIAALMLDRAGIEHDTGGLKVTGNLRTTNRRVYAIGDVAGGPQFTHAANYHAALVIRALLFRLPARENRCLIPRVTFTDPELAHIGLTEDEAKRKRAGTKVLRWPFADNDRAQTEHQTGGFIKLVTSRRGRILGVSVVGHGAGEMMNFWSLALSRKLTVRDIAGYIAPYPTLGEVGKRAALTYFADAARSVPVRGLIRFLRLFG